MKFTLLIALTFLIYTGVATSAAARVVKEKSSVTQIFNGDDARSNDAIDFSSDVNKSKREIAQDRRDRLKQQRLKNRLKGRRAQNAPDAPSNSSANGVNN